jgi:hypothetical protein
MNRLMPMMSRRSFLFGTVSAIGLMAYSRRAFAAAPALDGHAKGTGTSNLTITATLTTASANDVIIVQVWASGPVSTVTSPGLTFTSRLTGSIPANSGSATQANYFSEWWAPSSGILTAAVITATFGSTVAGSVLAFGISGGNTSTPFDASLTLPTVIPYSSSPSSSGSFVATTATASFLFSIGGSCIGTTFVAGTIPAGFSFIDNGSNSGGTNWANVGAAYKSFTSAQNNLFPQWNWFSSSNNWSCITDALQSANSSAPTLDGHANGIHSGGTTCTVTLTTTQTNDIIIVGTAVGNNSSTPPTVSNVSGGGLTWARRSRAQCLTVTTGNSGYSTTEEWWALAPTALTGTVITITYSGTIDDSAAVAFGVNGCNTSTPFDTNGSLPVNAFGGGQGAGLLGGAAATAKLTTSSANTLAIGWTSAFDAGTTYTPSMAPSGFTLIDDATAGALGSGNAYGTFASPQSGTTVTWGDSPHTSTLQMVYILDALVSGSSPGGSAGSLPLLGVGN